MQLHAFAAPADHLSQLVRRLQNEAFNSTNDFQTYKKESILLLDRNHELKYSFYLYSANRNLKGDFVISILLLAIWRKAQ